MNPADPTDHELDELAAVIGRELRHLPAPRAPHALLSRVMAAVPASRPAPRTWFTWPLLWQALSVAALALLVAGAALVWPTVQRATTTAMNDVTGAAATRVAAHTHGVAAIVSIASSLWRGLLHPIAGYLFLLAVVLCAACAAFGAALGRVALGGASQS
jgi:hypothetical protein